MKQNILEDFYHPLKLKEGCFTVELSLIIRKPVQTLPLMNSSSKERIFPNKIEALMFVVL